MLPGLLWPFGAALAQVCAAPGAAGAVTLSGNSVVNTYYIGGTAVAGNASLTLGSATPRAGGGPALAAGDLVMVIQMQDGTGLNTTNTSAYGGGGAAAGRYELVRVASVSGTTVNLTSNLVNSYTQNTAATNNQTFQVIRIPQYATLVNNGNIVPLPWDGTTGGVVAMDVSGTFTNNGSVNASFAGFRGNAGLSLAGQSPTAAIGAGGYDYVRPNGYLAHGGKGEGIAGTPDRVLQVFASPGVLQTGAGTTANGNTTNGVTSANLLNPVGGLLVTTGRSYNGGSRSGGAAGNAGGGGVDSSPQDNSENSGGGGGSSWGSGGKGGNTWNTNFPLGGMGGAGAASSTPPTWTPAVTLLPNPTVNNRLIMGGGGGSGTSNNGYSLNTSGGAGGGLIFIKAQALAGAGTLLANGQAGRSVPLGDGTNGTFVNQCPSTGTNSCDGAGGGGAGGGIVVLGPTAGTINAQVRGGDGGNINGQTHGPGGGGGGGYIFATTGITIAGTIGGGAAGQQTQGAIPAPYGAFGATGGNGTVAAVAPSFTGGLPAACLPALTTTKVTAIPASVASIVPPGTTTYSIVFTNQAGRGDATGISLFDPALPSTMTVLNPPAGTVTFAPGVAPTACGLSTRTAVVNPPNGAATNLTAGTFSLPGGCTATFTFTINVPITVPDGTYNNSAVAYFRDPTDSSGTRTVTNGAFTGGVPSPNTSFTLGGAVGGSNYDGSLAANVGEDIRVQRLQLWKAVTLTSDVAPTGTVSPGDTVTWSIFARNPGATSVAIQVTDTLPLGLNFTAGTQTVNQTAGTCGAIAGPPGARNPAFDGVGNLALLSGTSQPLPGGCTIRIDVPMAIPSTTALTSTTNTSALAGTTTVGVSPQVSSSNLDTPTGTASGVPGIGSGNFPAGLNISQAAAIQVTPTVAAIRPAVNLSISKTNAASALQAGTTTAYTITVANLGPSTATLASLTDPVASGLACTAVTCTGATGAAVCPPTANVTIANIQGTGIGVTLPPNSSLTFRITCNVTATGSFFDPRRLERPSPQPALPWLAEGSVRPLSRASAAAVRNPWPAQTLALAEAANVLAGTGPPTAPPRAARRA